MYAVSIVACVSPVAFRKTRPYLARALDTLMVDDRSYFYRPGHYETRQGYEAASDIFSGPPRSRFDLGDALESVVSVMRGEDPDLVRHVFVVLDEVTDEAYAERQVRRGFGLDLLRDTRCAFHILDIGAEKPWLRQACDERTNCDYRRLKPAEIADAVHDRLAIKVPEDGTGDSDGEQGRNGIADL